MVVVGLLVAFTGSASATMVDPAGSTATWAYGGQNSSSGTVTLGNLTATWNTSIGVVVIFNATPTGANTTQLEAQRTIGISVLITIAVPNGSVTFSYKALEVDTAYANITNASSVDVAGVMVPALGIDNSSFHGTASLTESIVGHAAGRTAAGYLNVSAEAAANVQFTPALGLIPLDLTGVSAWNSTATAAPSATWNVSYNYAYFGWNNTTGSGGTSRTGSWDATGPVALTGNIITVNLPSFRDHAPRVGILLTLQGPADIYDGFIIVPHAFDLFGGAHHVYDNESLSNVSISGDVLFLSAGHVGAASLTASELAIGRANGAQPLVASPTPAASNVGASVVAQPESVSAAQSQSHCLEFGCAAASPWFTGLVAAAVIGGLIAAVAGTVGVVEWRSYARRKNRTNQLVGGYSEGLANGIPTAVLQPPTSRPQPPMSGPSNNTGTGRLP